MGKYGPFVATGSCSPCGTKRWNLLCKSVVPVSSCVRVDLPSDFNPFTKAGVNYRLCHQGVTWPSSIKPDQSWRQHGPNPGISHPNKLNGPKNKKYSSVDHRPLRPFPTSTRPVHRDNLSVLKLSKPVPCTYCGA